MNDMQKEPFGIEITALLDPSLPNPSHSTLPMIFLKVNIKVLCLSNNKILHSRSQCVSVVPQAQSVVQ